MAAGIMDGHETFLIWFGSQVGPWKKNQGFCKIPRIFLTVILWPFSCLFKLNTRIPPSFASCLFFPNPWPIHRWWIFGDFGISPVGNLPPKEPAWWLIGFIQPDLIMKAYMIWLVPRMPEKIIYTFTYRCTSLIKANPQRGSTFSTRISPRRCWQYIFLQQNTSTSDHKAYQILLAQKAISIVLRNQLTSQDFIWTSLATTPLVFGVTWAQRTLAHQDQSKVVGRSKLW